MLTWEPGGRSNKFIFFFIFALGFSIASQANYKLMSHAKVDYEIWPNGRNLSSGTVYSGFVMINDLTSLWEF